MTDEDPGTRFDRAYFDHWYRAEGFGSRARLARRVHYAVAAAEYLLERPVRSLLDVGCGEGEWSLELRRLRPSARYVGVEPSAYAVDRFGSRRNLLCGSLGDLEHMELGGPFDLVVCGDVLAYVGAAEVRAGLRAIAGLLGGVAVLEVFVAGDRFEGDLDGYRRRTAATYERWCAEAGLERIGPHLYAGASLWPSLAGLERPLGGGR